MITYASYDVVAFVTGLDHNSTQQRAVHLFKTTITHLKPCPPSSLYDIVKKGWSNGGSYVIVGVKSVAPNKFELNFSGKLSATLQLLSESYSFTQFLW